MNLVSRSNHFLTKSLQSSSNRLSPLVRFTSAAVVVTFLCPFVSTRSMSSSSNPSLVPSAAGHPLTSPNLLPSISPKVLSIQSHTVHGYVGNKALTFPLQTMGFNVDCINTVSLSNHPGYTGGCKGSQLSKIDFTAMVDGLVGNKLLNHDVICTGYTSSNDILLGIEETVKLARQKNPDVLYILDPVLGDLGKYYVPEELVLTYKKCLLPLASAITPNQFEAEVLSGIKITSLSDALEACQIFHDQYGIQTCILTGLKLPRDKHDSEWFHSIIVSHQESPSSEPVVYRKIVPTIDRQFSGCGDLLSSLMANFLYRFKKEIRTDHTVLAHILDTLAAALTTVLDRTKTLNCKELCIVECSDVYRQVAELHTTKDWVNHQTRSLPIVGPEARRVKGKGRLGSLVAGIIFDVDGTLTEPGAIDFGAMYKRIGLTPSKTMDLIFQVEAMVDDEKREEAHRIIIDEELKGAERMILRPDVGSVLHALNKAKIHVAISTRNCDVACQTFLAATDDLQVQISTGMVKSSSRIFSPVITRESLNGINKPDPRVSYHIFQEWGFLQVQTKGKGGESIIMEEIHDIISVKSQIDKFGVVWFVGDSSDDMKCGRSAGCQTCLIRTDSNGKIAEENPGLVDLEVDSLTEFINAIGIEI